MALIIPTEALPDVTTEAPTPISGMIIDIDAELPEVALPITTISLGAKVRPEHSQPAHPAPDPVLRSDSSGKPAESAHHRCRVPECCGAMPPDEGHHAWCHA